MNSEKQNTMKYDSAKQGLGNAGGQSEHICANLWPENRGASNAASRMSVATVLCDMSLRRLGRGALRWAAGMAAGVVLVAGTPAAVAVAAERGSIKPLTEECLKQAAEAFGHPKIALALILAQERGKVGECSRPNRNGTVDCGAAQINEREVPKIARVVGLSTEETFRRVRDDGCFNIFVSSYILAQKKRDARGDLWDAMGRYNSATPGIKERYQAGLLRQYRRFFVEGTPSARGGGSGPASRVAAAKPALNDEPKAVPKEVAETVTETPLAGGSGEVGVARALALFTDDTTKK